MVSFGSKALPSRRHTTHNLTEDSLMAGEDNSYGRRKKEPRRKAAKGYLEFEGDRRQKGSSGWRPDRTAKPEKPFKHKNASEPQTWHIRFIYILLLLCGGLHWFLSPSRFIDFVNKMYAPYMGIQSLNSIICSRRYKHVFWLEYVCRKQVDPETAKYFSEIANVIEGNEVDLEERSIICGNALEEARGKELELATDYIISHTLQALLEGSDVDHLCRFLKSCAKDFLYIAMDRSGSHVAETALKCLALHLQDEESYTLVEETLATICKVSKF